MDIATQSYPTSRVWISLYEGVGEGCSAPGAIIRLSVGLSLRATSTNTRQMHCSGSSWTICIAPLHHFQHPPTLSKCIALGHLVDFAKATSKKHPKNIQSIIQSNIKSKAKQHSKQHPPTPGKCLVLGHLADFAKAARPVISCASFETQSVSGRNRHLLRQSTSWVFLTK